MANAANVISNDPFSLVEAAIWAALESSGGVRALVKVANRRRLIDTNPEPVRDSVTTEDLPELMVWPAGGAFNQPGSGVSSSSFSCVAQWMIGVTTDEVRTNRDRSIHAVTWACFCALMKMRNNGPYDLSFVTNVDVDSLTVQPGEAVPGRDRQVNGWKGLLSVRVRMVYAFAEVMA